MPRAYSPPSASSASTCRLAAIVALLAAGFALNGASWAAQEHKDRASLFTTMMLQNPARMAQSMMTPDLARVWTEERIAAFQAETKAEHGDLAAPGPQKEESLPTGYFAVYTVVKLEKGVLESVVLFEDARPGAPISDFVLAGLAHFTPEEAAAAPGEGQPVAAATSASPEVAAPGATAEEGDPMAMPASGGTDAAIGAADSGEGEEAAPEEGDEASETTASDSSADEAATVDPMSEPAEAVESDDSAAPAADTDPAEVEAPAPPRRQGPVEIAWSTAPYESAAAVKERPVDVADGSATLVEPKSAIFGAAPAVLFYAGPGADSDADHLFKNLSNGLAARGAITMRFSGDVVGNGRWDDGVDAAAAALATLRSQPGVDPAQVYLAGHGLGATLAPEIARRNGNVAGLAMLSAQSAANVALLERELAGAGGDAAALLDELKSGFISSADFFARLPESASARRLDFASVALDLGLPMIFLHGSLDESVTWEDRATWQTPLGAEERVAFYSYGRLNHWLVEEDETGAPAGFAARAAFDDLALWLAESSGLPELAIASEAPPVEDDLSGAGEFTIGAGSAEGGAGDGVGTLDFGDAEDDLDGVGVFELK